MAQPLVSRSLAEYLESGLSFTVASRDDELRVTATRAWAALVHEERDRLTLFVYGASATELLANLERHPQIAVCVDRPSTSQACQIKGLFESVRPAREDEREEVQRQTHAFLTDLETIGIPRAMTAGWPHWPCVALEMRVTELYEQTPGPGSGERMRPGRVPAGTARVGGAR